MPKPILTVRQAAELLQISTKTAYTWVNIKGFPKVRVGNCIRIPYDQLMDWVREQAGGPKEDAPLSARQGGR